MVAFDAPAARALPVINSNTVLRLDPEYAETFYRHAREAILRDDYEMAVEYLEAAVDTDPEHSEAWYWLGWILLDDAERLDDAVSAFLRHLERNPGDARGHNDLAVAYGRSGRSLESLLSSARAGVLDPIPLHLFNLGVGLLQDYNRPDLAFEQYRAISNADHPDATRMAQQLFELIYPEP